MATKKEDVTNLLMPKATAVWLVENTALSFEQIADFTGMHPIEVQALADEEVGRGIVGRNPLEHAETTQEELDRAAADPAYRMRKSRSDLPSVKLRARGPRYTPVSKRQDKPDAVSYLLKHNPELTDAQICRLIGTTKPTIEAVRSRTHPNSQNIKARHPVDSGLCTYQELEAASRKALKAQGKDPDEIKAQREKVLEDQEKERERERAADNPLAGFDFSNFLKKDSSGSKS